MKSISKNVFLMLIIFSLLGAFPMLHPTTQTTNGDAPPSNFALAQDEPWLSGFWYRRTVSITSATGAGTDYQVLVNVTYQSAMQSDFDDIRFTDNDAETEIDYWRQEYSTSTYAVFWVEVADSLETAGSIYMYYGNSGVSTTSNGYATFQFFEDWEEGSVNATRWDTDSSGGSSSFSATDANHGGYVHKIEGGAANGIQHYSTVANTSSETAVLFRGYLEETVASFQRVYCGMPSKIVLYSNYGTNAIAYYDDSKTQDINSVSSTYYDSWWTFEMQRTNDYGTDIGLFFANTTYIDNGSMTPDTTEDSWFYLYCRDEEYDLYNDWVAGRKFVYPDEPEATIGEQESALNWEEIDEITLWLIISIHPWGYQAFLILAGCAIVPLSTLYLAYSARNNPDSDKLYYGLLVFAFGWALIIGGII